jgi:hypothetical protein
MGKWLDVNAEVIYGNQTWTHYLEGDSVRYTYTGGDHIYAISLVWPGESLILKRIVPDPESQIYLLGYEAPLSWSFDEATGLTITIPDDLQSEDERLVKYAYSFKIEGHPNLYSDPNSSSISPSNIGD